MDCNCGKAFLKKWDFMAVPEGKINTQSLPVPSSADAATKLIQEYSGKGDGHNNLENILFYIIHFHLGSRSVT